ncbi:hypothetical protein [Clostridium sp. HBUAS56017]|uniref:hypothetical protein n=1 Tax=Clostridium sp. HBUAS56017 TaxID=2571128 RepID=UPI001177C8DD|nr:hypothetical protein [Clostridium sp. HBUAS56017]
MKKKRIVSLMLALALALGVSSQISVVASASTNNNTIATVSRSTGVEADCSIDFTSKGFNYTLKNPSSYPITVEYTIEGCDSHGNALKTYSQTVKIDAHDYIHYTRRCVGAVLVFGRIKTTCNGVSKTYTFRYPD